MSRPASPAPVTPLPDLSKLSRPELEARCLFLDKENRLVTLSNRRLSELLLKRRNEVGGLRSRLLRALDQLRHGNRQVPA